MRLLVFLGCLFACLPVLAQAPSGTHRDTIDVAEPPPYVLRPFVLNGTERVALNGVRLDSTQYRIDVRRGRLWLNVPITPTDTLIAVYRTLPFVLPDAYFRRRLVRAEASDTVAVVEEAADAARGFDPFAGTNLQRSGSITRGVIGGTGRDVSVESGLRMQLSGEITPGVEVNAVLTDENTPIQPEGTTQRLNDFDRVAIELRTEVGEAQLGDFDLRFAETEFARFSRKLQGVGVRALIPDAPGSLLGPAVVTAAGATARGLFRSQQLQPIDGVQGPYRLEGDRGELFIIVIAGSENVYLDGVLMTRGERNDYVIDYGTGEVTFTARRLITSDRRITVDFEYTTSQFTRALVATEGRATLWQTERGPRAHLTATVLREADSRSFDQQLGLTDADVTLLENAGDALATRSGAERVAFQEEAPYVQYEQREQYVPALDSTLLVFAALQTATADSVYRVRFSRVPNGSYRRVGRGISGIQYEFAGPGQGQYEPVRLLPAPELRQLIDVRATVEPVRHLEVIGEWAQSTYDRNRFSSIDSDDDAGNAHLVGLLLRPVALPVGTLSGEVRRRYTGPFFRAFDRTRPVEFGRRWNLASGFSATGGVVDSLGEATHEGRLRWDVSPRSWVQAEAGQLRVGEAFAGDRWSGEVALREAFWPRVTYAAEWITTDDRLAEQNGRWLRQRGAVRQPLGPVTPLVEFEHEDRRQRDLATDVLASNSFAFTEVRPGIEVAREGWTVAGLVAYRVEQEAAEGLLRDAATAWTAQTRLAWQPSRTFSTEADVGYRIKSYTPYFREAEDREDTESVVVQWTTQVAPFRRALDVRTFYEALTERTPILQETYIKVGSELGEYVWEDANGDGIRQLDEFLLERTPYEGTYLRTFVPSDELRPVINVNARIRLALTPSRWWRAPEGWWQQALAAVGTQTTLEVREKSEEDRLARIYLLDPDYLRRDDTTLNGQLRFNHRFDFFRTAPGYGASVALNQLRSQNRLAAGLEKRLLNTWRAEGTYRIAGRVNARLVAQHERNRVQSDAFATRRFDITGISLEPEVSWQPTSALTVTAATVFARKNDTQNDRSARVWRLPLEARYARLQKLNLFARAERADIALNGDAEGLAAYELTEGRGAGVSYLWNVTGQYTINAFLRASVFYDGRAPADRPVIHTVRMQVSASF